IDVTSKHGEGSRFRFNIQTVAAKPVGSHKPRQFPELVVLAVDDHLINRRALRIALDHWHCRSMIASNSAEALEKARALKPALAIIDHDLAGESGEKLVEELRQLHPELLVVFLTDAAEGVRRGETTEHAFVQLPKPIQPAVLGECVTRLLSGTALSTAPKPEAQPTAPLAEAVPLDILLVEDNAVNQKVALHLLNRLGYRADAVGNGLEAVSALKQRDYDLVFMDVQMPEMDGFAATREIRAKLPKSRQPKIVALTANAVQGDREHCLTAGMDDYVAKPVKLEGLRAVIVKHFKP
ncbi:MAG: response regulator, partial [Candidatus Didemnitutus sp.]|nr:response regulator [Candidatus Didemnitutus sp.]